MHKVEAQISRHIGHVLWNLVSTIFNMKWFFQRTTQALIKLCRLGDKSEPSLSAYDPKANFPVARLVCSCTRNNRIITMKTTWLQKVISAALYYRDQTWFFNVLTFARSLGWSWKLRPSAFGRGFQDLPRDLANVNALKNHVRSLLLHKNWKHLLHFALFVALFCFVFSQMSRERNFHGLCSF